MIQFLVQDMTCNHCIGHVTDAVHSVAPQARVDIDLASKAVVIHHGDDRQRIAEAIRDAGYTPVAS
ncbi:MAG: heavy-metal-associated domain-containing protein [Janthinobacterium lividum]